MSDAILNFLPWVIATRIISNNNKEMVADMVVGFKSLREKFTSRVIMDRARLIDVQYLDGPLRNLSNTWVFRSHPNGGCEIDFSVDFTFKSKIFESLAGQYVDRAFQKMVQAFNARAAEVYGKSSFNA